MGNKKGTRRSNGEGSISVFIKKQKKKLTGEMCNICKNCDHKELCNNRENCKLKCEKCKNCTECLTYCDRYYCYEVHVNQNTKKDGKPTTPQYSKKKKDAVQKNLDNLEKTKYNIYIDKSTVTLYDIAKEIIENRLDKNITIDNSYIDNQNKLKRLAKHDFMNIPVQKITDEDLHDYLKYMTNYSQSVITKDIGLLNAALYRAARKKVISSNPLDDKDEFPTPRSKQIKEKVRAFTIKEQQKFLKNINMASEKYKYSWLLMLFAGLRPGEAYAIDKDKDIDFEEKKLHIRNTITKDKNGNQKLGDRTKTYSGIRDIDIDDDLELILRQSLNVSITNENNLLFCNDNGSLISISASNSAFKRFCEKYEIGEGFKETQYVLRHSAATRKIESGMPAELVRDFLGHKKITVTLDTYFDAFEEYKKKHSKDSQNYYIDVGINYAQISPELILLREISNLLSNVKKSHLNNFDKQRLLYELTLIKQNIDAKKSSEKIS